MVRTEWTEWPDHVQDHGAQQLPEISADAPRGIRRTRVEDQRRNSVAERSKALASGARPQGRGFEPHSCQCWSTKLRGHVPDHYAISVWFVKVLNMLLAARTPQHTYCPMPARAESFLNDCILKIRLLFRSQLITPLAP